MDTSSSSSSSSSASPSWSASPGSNAPPPRRTHLKRLSLSVSSRDSNTAGSLSLLNANGLSKQLHDSPIPTPVDGKAQYATVNSPPPSLLRSRSSENSGGEGAQGMSSPLHRSLGSNNSTGRRQRPTSMYSASSSSSSPLPTRSSLLNSSSTSTSTPQRRHFDTQAGTPDNGGDFAATTMAAGTSSSSTSSTPSTATHHKLAHPLASPSPSTTTFDASIALSPAGSSTSSSPIVSPSNNNNGSSSSSSTPGRRSILGRSAHARRQSSISYARSPANDSFGQHHSPNTSRGNALAAIQDDDEEEEGEEGQERSRSSSGTGSRTPLRRSIIGESNQGLSPSASARDDVHSRESEVMVPSKALSAASSSNNELNVGPGARSSDLLTFIAKKERRCLDLREELKRNEAELEALKKKWEAVIQREMAASAASAAASASPSAPSHGSSISPSSSREGGLFSSLANTLNASTSSNTSTTSQSVASPSPKPSSASRRLLTSRHSISVASPSSAARHQNGTGFFQGGSDLSPQTSPLDALSSGGSSNISAIGQGQAGYDVQKIAKSWFGGVMKSASTVLDTLAPPPPSQNDLHTVAEEDEEAEEEQEHRQHRQRSAVGHPGAAIARGSRSPHNRESSTATAATTMSSETSSPSSSCEDGQFSSNASRSSSVSSLHSDNVKDDEKDITPVATPVLPPGTPRAQGSEEERDLWALSGDFEDDTAREKREGMERNRIDLAKGSPRKQAASSSSSSSPRGPPTASRSANHGRRRSTAFELGGAWGAMVGKKWNEMASTLSASETFKTSSKRAMGIMEDFERSLSEAITPDPNAPVAADGINTQLTLINGELIPTGSWSPVSSPQMGELDKSLPSGIGGPSAWSALLGRGRSAAQAPTSPQSGHAVDMRDKSMSPGSMPRSLLDEDDPLTSHQPVASPNSLSAAQERIQASRAKHAKRMSLPANVVAHAENRNDRERQTQGLGLANVNESDEDESAWGW